MQQSAFFVSLTTALVLTAPSALAENFYAEGFVSHVDVDAIINSALSSDDPSFESIGLRGGYEITDYWAIEGDIETGLSSESLSGLANNTASNSASADLAAKLGLYARASVPVTENVKLFTRLGYAQTQLDVETSSDEGSFSNTEIEDGIAYGFGVIADVNENLYLRADFTEHQADTIETRSFSVGAGWRF